MSLLAVAAVYWTNLSLHRLPYTVKIVVKSCRILPVMLLSVPLQGRRYTARQYAAATAMVAGVLLFFVGDWPHLTATRTSLGGARAVEWAALLMLCAALVLDALVANLEEQLFFRCAQPAGRVEVMTYLSACGSVYAFAVLLMSGTRLSACMLPA